MSSWFSKTPQTQGQDELASGPHKEWHKDMEGKRIIADMQWDLWIRDFREAEDNNPILNACLLGNVDTLNLLIKSRRYCTAMRSGLDAVNVATTVIDDGLSARMCEMLMEAQEACERGLTDGNGKYGYVACHYCALPEGLPPTPPHEDDE